MSDAVAIPDGWVETQTADGTVHVAMTPLAQLLLGIGSLVAGVPVCLFGWWWAGLMSRPGLIALLPLGAGAGLCLFGLKTILVREEWRLGDNFFEITHLYLGFIPLRRRYLGAAIHLVPERRGRAFHRYDEWLVRVERKNRRPVVYASLDRAEALAVAEYLRQHTGWPLRSVQPR
jgi:hypothetical protein